MKPTVHGSRTGVVIGWSAVGFSLIASCFWAFWGTLENFHEGWYFPSLLWNLALTAAYLTPMAIVVIFALLAIRWPVIGGSLHALAGIFILTWWVYVRRRSFSFHDLIHVVGLTAIVLVIVGIAYMMGRPRPRWLATGLVAGLPLLVCFACVIEPVWRVAHRLDDGISSARLIQGNGVQLIWAPAGPGWPEQGNVGFADAERIVSLLNEDGVTCAQTPQNIWRLPTIEEVVRSLTRNGNNAGGQWDAAHGEARYRVMPDKESPLWHVASPVIYWWTSSRSPDGQRIYTVCFNGRTPLQSRWGMGSTAFRAVKESRPTNPISHGPIR